MKLKSGLEQREVGGQSVLVSVDLKPGDPGFMVVLNGTGAFLCELLSHDTDADKMTTALMEHYEVAPETARESVARFLEKLSAADLIEQEN